MKKLIILILSLFSLVPVFSQKGYEIKVKIHGFKDTSIILGHHFAKSMYPDDTVRLDKNGVGVFKGKTPLPQGMYIVFLPSKNYFDIIVGDNQVFEVENDTADLFKNIKFKNSPDNQLFYDYQFFLMKKREEVRKLQEARKNAKTEEEKTKIAAQIAAIDTEVKAFKEKATTQNPNSFIAKFIKATQDIEVPEPPKDAQGRITDSLFQYRYYRTHYFDNFDISDGRLLRTPLYEDKIMTYIEKVIPQFIDTINKEVDFLIEKSRTSPELFRYMLVTLFNHYGKSQIMGFDGIALHIGEKYYVKEATWADTAYIKKLKKQIEEKSPTLIGKIAPNIELIEVPVEHFMHAADDTSQKRAVHNLGPVFNLKMINKDFTILYFWDVDCGHCKKETPLMRDVYKRLKDKNVELVSVCLVFSEENKIKWVNFVNENQLYDWKNAFYPYSIKFKELYDIQSAPQLFILDKNKKIIAKRISPEQCEEIINHEIGLAKKKKQ